MNQIRKLPTAASGNGDTADLPAPDRMICACAQLDFQSLRKILADSSRDSFDRLLDTTGAGRTCTACLLDLEYYFSTLRGAAADADGAGAAGQPKTPSSRSLKQRAYALLDRFAPKVAWVTPSVIPVLGGSGLESRLIVTNHDLLFEDRHSAELAVLVRVRDSAGAVVWRDRFRVGQGDELRVRLDEHLSPEDGAEIYAGSADVRIRATRPALRGTSRPQIEILSAAGACAVHAQAIAGPSDTFFTVQARPDEERHFLVVLNGGNKEQQVELTAPHTGAPCHKDPAIVLPATLAARGAHLFEAPMAPDLAPGTTYGIRTRCSGPNKIFLLCATPSLDRFSIDHP